MIRHTKMEKFVRYHKVLELLCASDQISSQRNRAKS